MTAPPSPQVFISYRREDSAGYARAIHDALAERLGHSQVFMDVDDIGAGEAFDAVIHHAVGGSKVLLVLIGARWAGERPGQPPRIDGPADLVRREVEAGLAKGMHVIPLLLDGTPMPAAASLPESLRALSGRNAMSIGNASFATDIERLLTVVQARLGPADGRGVDLADGPGLPARRRTLGLGLTAGGLAVVGTSGAALWWWTRGRRPTPEPAAPPARPAVNGRWQASVRYEWQNADGVEHFEFSGTGRALQGTASFLGVPRGLLEGEVDADGLRFVTRTREMDGAEQVHRYRGELVGEALHLSLQTEGGSSHHAPVRLTARRVAAAAQPPMPATPAAPAPQR